MACFIFYFIFFIQFLYIAPKACFEKLIKSLYPNWIIHDSEACGQKQKGTQCSLSPLRFESSHFKQGTPQTVLDSKTGILF